MARKIRIRVFFVLVNLFLLISLSFFLKAQELSSLIKVKPGRSHAVTSADPDPNSNKDRIGVIEPGKTVVLADILGPAVIRHIWLTFNEARPNWLEDAGSARPDEIVLRMYWDDHEQPAVETPLGDFFAAGFGLRREIRSVPVQVEGGDGYNCYWPMPFYRHAVITITNESQENIRSFYYHIDYIEEVLPERTGYFCAQYRNEFPEKTGGDYLILDAEGEGHYIGTVMSVRSRSPLWFGDGDAKFYVDGDKKPTIQGTGTEDYFLFAWGLKECLFPYFGCSYISSEFDHDLGVQYCLYRWHTADPVRFTKSIHFEIEHKGGMSGDETETGKAEDHVEREDDMATVAFWYQVGQPKRFTTIPPLAGRILPNLDLIIEGKTMHPTARYSGGRLELQKGYDWTSDGQLFFQPNGDGTSLEVDFNITKEEYRGLVLRLTQAEDYGIYRIFLDGKNVWQLEGGTGEDKPADFDLYSPTLVVKDNYLGSFKLLLGTHTLRFECAGRNALSKGNYLGVDSVRLRERFVKKRKPLF
jgi:hypothetical protein